MRLIICFTFVFIFLFANCSLSANIVVIPNNTLFKNIYQGVHIEISGEIVRGDYEKLLKIYDEYIEYINGKAHSVYPRIRLDSQGGNVAEAFKMGAFLRKIEANTGVNVDGECSSSCIFLLASGVIRDVWMGGKLGLHRPRFDYELYGSLSKDEAELEYRKLIDAAEAFLDRMGIHEQVISDMLSTPSRSIKYVGRDYAEKYGLNGKDPAWEEWKYAQEVRKYGEKETDAYHRLLDCEMHKKWTPELREYCEKKYHDEMSKIRSTP